MFSLCLGCSQHVLCTWALVWTHAEKIFFQTYAQNGIIETYAHCVTGSPGTNELIGLFFIYLFHVLQCIKLILFFLIFVFFHLCISIHLIKRSGLWPPGEFNLFNLFDLSREQRQTE